MRSAGVLNDYWNRHLDPVNWKREESRTDPARWRQAYETFLTPATSDAIRKLGDLRGKGLLEIGCGHGYGSLHLARLGARVVGIDVSDRRCSAAVAQFARGEGSIRGRAQFCSARAEQLPFPDGSFDLVFCRDVLMYADPESLARSCHRVLVPGGRAVFVESLAGPRAFGWFRRLTSSRDYLGLTRHLSWKEIAKFGSPLELVSIRAYYLLSTAAFFGLFVLRSRWIYKLGLRCLGPVDRKLLDLFPSLSRLAWRATALYRKEDHA